MLCAICGCLRIPVRCFFAFGSVYPHARIQWSGVNTVDGQEQGIFRKGSVREDGVEILRYRLEFFVDRDEALNDLHRQIAQRAEEFCRENLAARARRAFEESDDPQKRFRFPTFLYVLRATGDGEKDSCCDVTLEAALCRRGESEPLYSKKKNYRWFR